jgi:hypothetical protein
MNNYLERWQQVKKIVETDEDILRALFENRFGDNMSLGHGSRHRLCNVGRILLPDRELHLAYRIDFRSPRNPLGIQRDICEFDRAFRLDLNPPYFAGIIQCEDFFGILEEDVTCNGQFSLKGRIDDPIHTRSDGKDFFLDPDYFAEKNPLLAKLYFDNRLIISVSPS